MPETKHTPLPWRLYEGDDYISVGTTDPSDPLILDTIGQRSNDPDRPEDEQVANAEFIVRAVNSHDDLLAVCRAVLDRHSYQGTGEPWPALFEAARAAVAKAEGR